MGESCDSYQCLERGQLKRNEVGMRNRHLMRVLVYAVCAPCC